MLSEIVLKKFLNSFFSAFHLDVSNNVKIIPPSCVPAEWFFVADELLLPDQVVDLTGDEGDQRMALQRDKKNWHRIQIEFQLS